MLESFVANFSRTAASSKADAPNFSTGRTLTVAARALFAKHKDSQWYLTGGESQECECKRAFDPSRLAPVVRAVAALANNRGGYIFFGVIDRGGRVEGIDSTFIDTDMARIMEKIKAYLSPTPSITAKETIEFDGKIVGFIRVERHENRPVIIYRDGDGLNEGEILFRYPGQSSRIKFGDLRAMLEERDRRTQIALADAAGRMANIGTANRVNH